MRCVTDFVPPNIMRRLHLISVVPVLLSLSVACRADERPLTIDPRADSARSDSIARARQDSFNRAQPGYVVDSIHSPEEEIRRFRAAFPGDSATRFVGGSASRRALAHRFIRAIAANDTADLLAMAIHGREFVDLYYPDSPYSHPPYHQTPSFAWRMIQQPSSVGLSRLLKRAGGKPLQFVSEKCDPKVLREGRITRYAGCLVRVVNEKGDTSTRRYYGSIVEHDGQFKFLSYTNDL